MSADTLQLVLDREVSNLLVDTKHFPMLVEVRISISNCLLLLLYIYVYFFLFEVDRKVFNTRLFPRFVENRISFSLCLSLSPSYSLPLYLSLFFFSLCWIGRCPTFSWTPSTFDEVRVSLFLSFFFFISSSCSLCQPGVVKSPRKYQGYPHAWQG